MKTHLETARLRLRPVDPADEALVVAAMNDFAVSGWTSRVPYPYTAADFHDFATRIAQPGETFVMQDVQGLAGIISADPELGYWVAPRAQGLGYATEAGRVVLAELFAAGRAEVLSGYFAGNARSANVLTKLGFRETTREMSFSRSRGAEVEVVKMALRDLDYGLAHPLTIETARLRLAPLLADRDWRAVQAIGGQPQVARMLSSVRSPWPEQAVRDWIAFSSWRGRVGFRLGIWLKDGPLIGTVGIGGAPVTVAYFLDPAHWGQGYATEAMAGFLADVMARYDLAEVGADHFVDNPASGQVLRKLGFRFVGESMGHSRARVEVGFMHRYRLAKGDLTKGVGPC